MEKKNKVTVKIYGQEYTIAGDTPREHIMRVADYVNTKMHEIARALPAGSVSSLAVLSAVNVADDVPGALAVEKVLQPQGAAGQQLQRGDPQML